SAGQSGFERFPAGYISIKVISIVDAVQRQIGKRPLASVETIALVDDLREDGWKLRGAARLRSQRDHLDRRRGGALLLEEVIHEPAIVTAVRSDVRFS